MELRGNIFITINFCPRKGEKAGLDEEDCKL